MGRKIVKYIVIEWEELDYAGREGIPYIFHSKKKLLDYCEDKKIFDDIDIYEVKAELEPYRIKLRVKKNEYHNG